MFKKIELLANVAIIITALLLGAALVKRSSLTASDDRQDAAATQQRAGAKAPLADVDWERNDKTVVLVLSKSCGYCTESAPFYQRLVEESKARGNVGFIAVLPQAIDEGRDYLKERGVAIEDVRESPDILGLSGTPTLLLVDKVGVITDVWVGKLSAEGEAQVLSKVS